MTYKIYLGAPMLRQNSTCLLTLPLTCDKMVPLDSSNLQASFPPKVVKTKRHHLDHFELPPGAPPAPGPANNCGTAWIIDGAAVWGGRQRDSAVLGPVSWAVATVAAAGTWSKHILNGLKNQKIQTKIGVGGWVGNEINARMENASERKQTTLWSLKY